MLRATPVSPRALASGMGGLLRARARATPDRPAIRTPDTLLTWRALDAEVDRTAAFWRAQGVGAGQTVGLWMGNDPELLIQVLGCARAGAATALVHPEVRGEGLLHALQVAAPAALVHDGERGASLPDAVAALPFSAGRWFCGATGEANDVVAARRRLPSGPVRDPLRLGDTPFCYLYTSGTTGRPKAAVITHRRALLGAAAFQTLAVHATADDVVFTPLPLAHASALLIGFGMALWSGAAFAFTPGFSARRYWSDARHLGATIGLYVGELCRYLAATPPSAADRDHAVGTMVGNGLRADVWPDFTARFGIERVIEFYGATESNALLLNTTNKVGSCGRPVLMGPLDATELIRYDAEHDAHPRDRRGRCQRCGPDEPGELIVRIGLLPTERFDGYLDRAATEAKILRGVFRRGDAWFRTGDLLRRDAEGDWFFIDRVGDTFRWKGENISAQQVQEALVGSGGVVEAAVYGVEIPGCEGRAGMAAVTGDALDGPTLYARVAATLPPAGWPAFIRRRDALDRTATLKYRKLTLMAEGFDPARCGDDPLLVRLDAERTYAPLTPAHLRAVQAGDLRL
ncbi:MAG: AMP-binding protein [Myxococcales bacterium]|nr:AMP-binding protein [Myxococcales bacterium]